MTNRKTQYGWMVLGGLICLFGMVLACKLREGNRLAAQQQSAADKPKESSANNLVPPPAVDSDQAAIRGEHPPDSPQAKANKKTAEPPPAPLEATGTLLPPISKDKKPEPSATVSGTGGLPDFVPPPTPAGNTPPITAAPRNDELKRPAPKQADDKALPPLPATSLVSWDSVAPAGSTGTAPRKAPMEPVSPPLAKDPKPSPPEGKTPSPVGALSERPLTAPPSAPSSVPPPSAPPSVPPPPQPPQADASPLPGEPPLAPPPGPVQNYQARGGETLRDIARRTLGSAERWTDVHKLNPMLQPDVVLAAGTNLRLPGEACIQPDEAEVRPLPVMHPKASLAKAKVVLPLTGTYPANLDDKKAMTLPMAIRDQLSGAETLLVSPGPDQCLWLTNQAHLERLAQRLEQSPAREIDVRVFKRLYFAQTEKAPLSPEGRVTISDRLAQFAGLHQEVVLVGIDDHFELWDAGRWRSYTQQKSAAIHIANSEPD
jgi:MraZ protein